MKYLIKTGDGKVHFSESEALAEAFRVWQATDERGSRERAAWDKVLEIAQEDVPEDDVVDDVSLVGDDAPLTTEQLLQAVQETQTAFWDALRDLENATGFELPSIHDYGDCSVDTLAELDGKDD